MCRYLSSNSTSHRFLRYLPITDLEDPLSFFTSSVSVPSPELTVIFVSLLWKRRLSSFSKGNWVGVKEFTRGQPNQDSFLFWSDKNESNQDSFLFFTNTRYFIDLTVCIKIINIRQINNKVTILVLNVIKN